MEELMSQAVLDESMFVALASQIIAFAGKLLFAAVILLVGRWLVVQARRYARRLMSRANIDPTIVSFTGNIIYFGGLVLVILLSLGQLGVQTTSLVAILGAASLAIGLALQGSLANFVSGILLIIFRPIHVGDWIEVGDISGYVEEVQILTTTVRTLNYRVVTIPNSSLTNGNIINNSAKPHIRMDMVFGVFYREDIDKVKAAIADILKAEPLVLEEPKPIIGLLEFGDSSVNFAVRPWVKPQDYWPAWFRVMEQMKKRFDADGISIPFLQRDVHIFQTDVGRN